MAGRAAYPNEHINSASGGVAAYVAVKRLSPVAKLEHLPQHRDALPRGSLMEDVQHGAHGIRIGVVAIVINQNPPGAEALSAHFPGREFAHRRGEAGHVNPI